MYAQRAGSLRGVSGRTASAGIYRAPWGSVAYVDSAYAVNRIDNAQ